jgi:hypothetical protein
VAEKFQAMVALGKLNIRLKDTDDVWAIANSIAFDGAMLSRAIQATFGPRQAPLPVTMPPGAHAGLATKGKASGPRSCVGPKSRWRPNRKGGFGREIFNCVRISALNGRVGPLVTPCRCINPAKQSLGCMPSAAFHTPRNIRNIM